MECPFCKCKTTKVVDKRDNREDNSTRRRRQCLRCSKRFTTYERIENIGVNIIKKDGSLVKFNTEKIIKGISKAVDFNKISKEQIEEFAEELEMEALNKEESMTTKEIGIKILDWLKQKDKLAYIRFASVYKDFKTIDDIEEEIEELKKNNFN